MTIAEHKTAAERARRAALDADLSSFMAEERGDTMGAAEAIDEREYNYHLAEHHEGIAAYAESIETATANTPGDEAIAT